jgi:integrase/recombinase XerD
MSQSALQLQLDAYLSIREALGFQMRAERTLLRDFVNFVESHGIGIPVRAYLAVEWACALSARRGPGGAAQRLSMARGFLTYLRATIPETEVPDSALVASFRRPKPYLFTLDQIRTLIQDAKQAKPQGALRPHTLSTLIGLLASTGLRVGEALRLRVTDVWLDGDPPCLHIRETKFYKSRLVPLHPSTADQLRHYADLRTALRYDALSDVFFVSEQGGELHRGALWRWFTTRCRTLGMRPTDEGRRPSLSALRHSFAVERMRRWYDDGVDVQARLPNLPVYMGHVRPQESYWYLSATPELLTTAAERFRFYAAEGGIS